MIIALPAPEIQIGFIETLARFRGHYLQDALADTVRGLQIPELDRELAEYAPADGLSALASEGLRGELVFPVPIILKSNPRLLGYYRLLYGFSQKEFYNSGTGLGRFRAMEESGVARKAIEADLPALAKALCSAAAPLVAALRRNTISAGLLNDLTLLTLGPQFRGAANVRKGTNGIRVVFESIRTIVERAVVEHDGARLTLLNATGRKVIIELAPDPDIVIREEMRADVFRDIVAIEVKAGADFSNIHNRVGEAEKSHQKAKNSGFVECWTIVNVDRVDVAMARRESPSTNRFYRISHLVAASGSEYQDFKDRIISLTGIAT
jgi:hypothetical protein